MAVVLTELDDNNNEYKRGMKALTIPAHNHPSCRDIQVKCIKFVLPEDISLAGDSTSICPKRRFKARVIHHYIDNDFDCCDELKNNPSVLSAQKYCNC